jgi:PAS domain S-box-containing protein
MANNLRSLRGVKHAGKTTTQSLAATQTTGDGKQRTIGDVAGGTVQSAALLSSLPVPAAIWSLDRTACVLNTAARELFGFSENELREESFWLKRVHPDDREAFLSATQRLIGGESQVSCNYRFLPKNETNGFWLREVSSYCNKETIWSFFSTERPVDNAFDRLAQVERSLRALTHEIGNNLQVMRGELDLLRLSGKIPEESSAVIVHGITHVHALAREIEEYLFPQSVQSRPEDPASVVSAVISSREKAMAARGIRTGVVLKEPLPKVPLDRQFGRALREVIDFSGALLPAGGELNIEAGLCRQEGHKYIELKIVSSSSASLQVEEGDVFTPFSEVNGYRPGISMALAQEILRRHFGKIAFRKEDTNRGIFSLLIRVPDTAHKGAQT